MASLSTLERNRDDWDEPETVQALLSLLHPVLAARLLTAVIERAPILRSMSLAGFRGSFLLRKGVLATRDGAWLSRVEREWYVVVLDRFPWSFGWVKLPWMEAPLRVEW